MNTLAIPDVTRESPTNRYLKVPDVAWLMDVPTSTVYDLARQNRIVGMVRFGRHIRFDRDKLERWLEQGGEQGTA
jgi:excisionase family DNA binding protein